VSSISVRSVLEAFPRQRLLVLSDVMLDPNPWGGVRRVSPEASPGTRRVRVTGQQRSAAMPDVPEGL
jgi:bifunctional ADP-heptose synthase (sugar kinase/adenylyltransferase)